MEQIFEIKKSDIMFGGMIVSANPFQLEDKNGKTSLREKGGISGINIENPQLDELRGADEMVTDSTNAILILSYPFKKTIGYRIQNDNGFNRENIALELSKAYSEIYSEKEKYVTGYDGLSDLELTMIMVFEVNGEIYLEPKVESKK
ncbi:MAG: hypothetical protein V4548_01585 [Bacteroidota bacterium]